MFRRLFAIASCLIMMLVVGLPSVGSAQQQDDGFDFQRERQGRRDRDARGDRVQPSATQRAAVETDETVRWNRLGTPAVVSQAGAFLAEGLPADPVEAARQWIAANTDLFGLSAEEVAALEVVGVAPVGAGHVVLLRQRFNGLAAGIDGLAGVGVLDGRIAHAWSSLTRDTTVTGDVRISAQDAVRAAAEDIGHPVDPGEIGVVTEEDGWTLLNVAGFDEPARARLVAVPTPADGVRPAWETLLLRVGAAEGFTHFVDAESTDVLVRTDLVDFAASAPNSPGNPEWAAFPVSPPLDYSTKDTREHWCWEPAPGCDVVVGNPASPAPWDTDAVTGTPWNTTRGNNARGTEKWNAPGDITQGTVFATPSPQRDYTYAWTNQWFEQRCNPATTFTSPQRNDIDAAITNMFVGHNRVHDWAYHLGFTEATWNMQEHNFGRGGLELDPEHGNAQAGGVGGGPPTYAARDNANQFSTPDGSRRPRTCSSGNRSPRASTHRAWTATTT